MRTGSDEEYITPSSANRIKDVNEKIGNFQRMDENGFGMTIMAMGIVFTALLVLCLSFYAIFVFFHLCFCCGVMFSGCDGRGACAGCRFWSSMASMHVSPCLW